MPLNKPPKRIRKKIYEYGADVAPDWKLLLKYAVRKLDVQGWPNPKGGLVELFYNSKDPEVVTTIQFVDRDEHDHYSYPKMRPRIYNGKEWLGVWDYITSTYCPGCKAHSYTNEGVAGHRPNVYDPDHFTGKFPKSAYLPQK